MLVHHAMPALIASLAELKTTGLPSRRICPRRLVEPVRDVHERRLARAVLAEEGMHFALRTSSETSSLATMPELLRDARILEDELSVTRARSYR